MMLQKMLSYMQLLKIAGTMRKSPGICEFMALFLLAGAFVHGLLRGMFAI
jgi:hypothetical protein